MINFRQPLFHVIFFSVILTLGSCAPTITEKLPRLPIDPVTIRIDNTVEHQVMEGFGATTLALVMISEEGIKDMLTPALRRKAIKAVYGQVGLTMGNLALWVEPVNDDDDPSNYNWNGFEWATSDAMHKLLVCPAQPFGFNNYSLGLRIDMRYELRWMADLRETDYERYLNEVAEYVTAGAIYWRKTFGLTPRYITLFNEPLSGNRELRGGTPDEVVDIVKYAGARLRAEGFHEVKFIVPGEETVEKSIETINTILTDEKARNFVGAIAYHAYPYGSPYSGIQHILLTSGTGHPYREEIQLRDDLKKLGRKYDIPVWMTEITEGPGNSDFEYGATENMRARAIHIHDELVYANASAYFGMHNMWDRRSHEIHFKNRNIGFLTEKSSIALVDQKSSGVYITGMGYAIGHYARWIKRGAMRIDATSSDPLIQVSAFRDDSTDQLTIVIINNSDNQREIIVQLKNLFFTGPITGEQSSDKERWNNITSLKYADHNRFNFISVAKSIITISTSFHEYKK